MASPIFPHIPAKKERGCFQCSRRRIICDKREPSCEKCTKKGIECSGLGRIRFALGVARRGRLKDCKIPDARGDALQEGCATLPTEISFQTLRWPEGNRVKKRRSSDADGDIIIPRASQAHLHSASVIGRSSTMREPIDHSTHNASPQVTSATSAVSEDDYYNVEEVVRNDSGLTHFDTRSESILSWIAPISPEARMLFSYFSEAVAPVMVVFDGNSNGYRSLVLPMALEDDVLRQAVGVVAAQHLSRVKPELKEVAESGRIAVISRLRRDALNRPPDKVFNKFTWATLIVLLVGETVTGSADYSFLVQMLLFLSLRSSSDDADPALMSFLQTQTHMFEMLGVPLLGEEVGVLTIMKVSDSLTDWLSYAHLPEDSEDRRTAELIRQCFISACEIYTRCATSANAPPSFGISQDLIQERAIEQLIGIMSHIPASARGAHALVWVCFVAGAETTKPAQREFFVHRMKQTYARTQFRNIPIAIQGLENIWSRNNEERWTLCLPRLSNVLVM